MIRCSTRYLLPLTDQNQPHNVVGVTGFVEAGSVVSGSVVAGSMVNRFLVYRFMLGLSRLRVKEDCWCRICTGSSDNRVAFSFTKALKKSSSRRDENYVIA